MKTYLSIFLMTAALLPTTHAYAECVNDFRGRAQCNVIGMRSHYNEAKAFQNAVRNGIASDNQVGSVQTRTEAEEQTAALLKVAEPESSELKTCQANLSQNKSVLSQRQSVEASLISAKQSLDAELRAAERLVYSECGCGRLNYIGIEEPDQLQGRSVQYGLYKISVYSTGRTTKTWSSTTYTLSGKEASLQVADSDTCQYMSKTFGQCGY